MDEKVIIRRYKRRSRIAIALTVLLVLGVLFSSLPIVVKLLLAAVLFAAEIVVLAVLITRTSNPLLTDRLDPKLHYTVCAALRAVPANGLTDILTAYYLYDYQAAYNLCIQKLLLPQYKKYKFEYKLYLARMYFDCGEIEKLRAVCEEFYAAFENNKNFRVIYGDLMRFYHLFCEGDYAACCDFYKQRMSEKAYGKKKLLKIQLDYGYAVARFRNGETEEAKMIFKSIANEVPQLNFGYIAKQYLEKIEYGEEREEYVTYTHDDHYIPPEAIDSKPSVTKWKLWVFFLAVAVVVIGLFYQDMPRTSLEAVKAYSESVTGIVCSLPVGDTNDLLCLCSNEYGNYTVAYLRSKRNDRYQCKIACDGLRPTSCYVIQSPDSDLVLYCTVYNDFDDIPIDAVVYAPFSENTDTQYFAITSLEEKGSWVYNGAWVESVE